MNLETSALAPRPSSVASRALLALGVLFALAASGCPKPAAPSDAGPPRAVAATDAGSARARDASADARDAHPKGPLPDDAEPRRYALELTLRPKAETFSGTVRIDLELKRAATRLYLHGHGLTVGAARLERDGAAALPAKYEQLDGDGVARVTFPSTAAAGAARLVLEYTGRWNKDLRGLYRVDEGGAAYAFTQFEPMSARLAFPGFDEPRFKTPFAISLVVPKGDAAISNAPELRREAVGDADERVTFAPTEPLPTYLVALAVGPLDIVTATPIAPTDVRKTPVPLRGIAARGKGPQLAYALRRAGEALRVLERYFGVAYPYAKLDLIAVPEFSSGAMENAGAITFREQFLLLDEASSSVSARRAFAGVLAHELAHQWFGDLVTTRWWDDVWLNEGFASWMTQRALALWRPDYRADLGSVETVERAMATDRLASARQVRQPIVTAHDVRNAFDSITYSKGAALLSMFERWLGEAPFQRGIRRYLERFRFKSATSDDFFGALSEGAGRDVSAAFRTFLEQPGLPELTVTPVCAAGAVAKVRLAQARHRPLGSKAPATGLWQIPACLRYEAEGGLRTHCALLRDREAVVELPGTKGCPKLLHPNADGAGYYRFVLPEGGFATLAAESARLTPRERFVLSTSLVAAVESGRARLGEALAALPTLAGPERVAVVAAMPFFSRLARELADSALRPAVEAKVRAIYGPLFERQGGAEAVLDPEAPASDPDTRQLRQALAGHLARVGREPALRAALAKAGAALLSGDEDALPPDLVALALPLAIDAGGTGTFAHGEALLRAGPEPALRGPLVRALASTTEPVLAEKSRALFFDPIVRQNERIFFLGAQLGRPETRDSAWAWLRSKWDAILVALPASHHGYIPLMTRGCTRARAEELRAFFAPRAETLPGGPRNVALAVEAVELCAALAERLAPELPAAFPASRAGGGVGAPR